jgi:hypothetical protein
MMSTQEYQSFIHTRYGFPSSSQFHVVEPWKFAIRSTCSDFQFSNIGDSCGHSPSLQSLDDKNIWLWYVKSNIQLLQMIDCLQVTDDWFICIAAVSAPRNGGNSKPRLISFSCYFGLILGSDCRYIQV